MGRNGWCGTGRRVWVGWRGAPPASSTSILTSTYSAAESSHSLAHTWTPSTQMVRGLLRAEPSNFGTEYAELLAVCPDAALAVAEAVRSRRPEITAKEKKVLLATCTAHVKANPAPDWLRGVGFFSQAVAPLQLGVAEADGCAIS